MNSINWARILAQTVYYFLSYFHFRAQLPSDSGVQVQYVVPTGNFGDVLAGYYAKKMGLPIGKLAVATNSNDILARFWKTGKYEKVDSTVDVGGGRVNDGKQATDASGVKETLSPAMDILVSSNFERLLWYLAYENSLGSTEEDRMKAACTTLDLWMGQVKSNGRVEVPVSVLQTARKDFVAERISDQQVSFRLNRHPFYIKMLKPYVLQTLETIKLYFEDKNSYVSDPHTAVGLAAARIISAQK